mmetsp:Transcript_109475/g.172606  ORF Transcript_109475/g.172606 Transcript_109475/m.172606 type:complete len:250 (-) Transcript_109475:7-756(-)
MMSQSARLPMLASRTSQLTGCATMRLFHHLAVHGKLRAILTANRTGDTVDTNVKPINRRLFRHSTPGCSSSARGIIHIPAMLWGAGKVGAVIGGLLTKKHAAGALAKWITELGAVNVLKSLRDLNDSMLASGGQSKESHAAVATSIANLESQLQSVAENEQLRILKDWLENLESKAPRLAVALGHAYLDTFKSVKMAKAVVKGVTQQDHKREPIIENLSPDEWEHKVHAAFPELKGYSILLVPKEETAK